MSDYYLIELSTKESGVEKALYGPYDKRTAEANFHSKLGGAMKNDAYLGETLVVLNDQGKSVDDYCYTIPSYTVTFDTDGGSAIPSQSVIENRTATEPEAPTKEGFDFDTWELNDVAYDFSTPVMSDITLKATWIALEPNPSEE